MAIDQIKELTPEELKNICPPDCFHFNTTLEIDVQEQMIGQARALRSMEFGLKIKKNGYNLFVTGVPGTGRNTNVLKAVEAIAATEPVPEDVCYLYNFYKPDEPRAIKLPPGMGNVFQTDMAEFINDVESAIGNAFFSDDYEEHKNEIIDRFEQDKTELNNDLDGFALSKGFALKQTLTEIIVIPLVDGKELAGEDFDALPEEEQDAIKAKQDDVYQKIFDFSRKVKDIQRKIKNEIHDFDKKVGQKTVGSMIDELKTKYREYKFIRGYLDHLLGDFLNNIEIFKRETDPPKTPLGGGEEKSKEDVLNKYQVNLIVDNSRLKGSPVVSVSTPNYYNMTGAVEYKAQFGVLTTDYMMIKGGAVHKASGGYLIIQAEELLKENFTWDFIKNVIRHKNVKMENLAERYGYVPTAGLKPEAVDVDLKIILVGSSYMFHMLYAYDSEFRKLFKVKVDFDDEMDKGEKFIQQYAYFIAFKCKEEHLRPFRHEAVAKVVEYSSRLVEHQNKMTARLSQILDIIREADYWANDEKAETVEAVHVRKAIEEKVYRSNMIEQKMQDMVEEETLILNLQGQEVGQVNGLSVLSMGDYSFGKPSRITARAYVGKGDILNIERETKMSGKIHSRGILILSGFFGEKFAQDKPLGMSASICFEQLYEEIDGDSASSAELYCLLSSLSDVPLRQDLAVTGAVDQRGQVQAIGGANEKIEGFFDACKIKGRVDTQGVMIPRANVKHLMLRDDVVEAVRQKTFHIYPIDTIDQGIALLTGLEAGVKNDKGDFSENSVYHRVNARLTHYVECLHDEDDDT